MAAVPAMRQIAVSNGFIIAWFFQILIPFQSGISWVHGFYIAKLPQIHERLLKQFVNPRQLLFNLGDEEVQITSTPPYAPHRPVCSIR
jgi:hypothetical protein